MGIPVEVQCDNAFGIRTYYGRPSKSALAMFARGVQRLHFIPDSQPTRNNSIERWNGTMYTEFWSKHQNYDGTFRFANIEECAQALMVWQGAYNRLRQHRSLPLRSGSRKFHQTPFEVHIPAVSTGFEQHGGCITFTRHLTNQGLTKVHSGITVYFPEYASRYVALECYLDGTGRALYAGQVVGTFFHTFGTGGKLPDVITVSALVPCIASSPALRVDALADARRLQKGLKSKRPVPSYLPKGHTLVNPDSEWIWIDEHGETVTSWRDSNADHIGEEVLMESVYVNE